MARYTSGNSSTRFADFIRAGRNLPIVRAALLASGMAVVGAGGALIVTEAQPLPDGSPPRQEAIYSVNDAGVRTLTGYANYPTYFDAGGNVCVDPVGDPVVVRHDCGEGEGFRVLVPQLGANGTWAATCDRLGPAHCPTGLKCSWLSFDPMQATGTCP